MSDSQSYEEITVSEAGLTVVKTFEADAFPVPAIAFSIESERDDVATVRLVDEVPADVAVGDLGFHPEYGSEFWTIEDDEITFERELEPGAEYTTVYGIRATGTDNVQQFLTEPEVTVVGSSSGGEEIVDTSGSDVVRDVIAGESDSVPGLDADEDEEVAELDLKDPNVPGDTEPDEEVAAASPEEGASEPLDLDVDDESSEDEGAGESIDLDTDEVSTDEGASESVELDVDDTPEEESTDEGASESVELDMDDTPEQDEVAEEPDLESGDAPDTASGIESVASALATELRDGEVPEEDLEVLRNELDLATGSVDARIERLQSDLSDVLAYTDALEEFLDDNGTAQQLFEDIRSEMDEIQEAVADLEESATANTEEISSLVQDVQELGSEVDAATDFEDEIQAFREEVEDLKEWRTQLSNVLGATGSEN